MRYFNLKLALFGALFALICIKGIDVVSGKGMTLPGNDKAEAGIAEPAKIAKIPPAAPNPADELKSLSPRPDITDRTVPSKSIVKIRKNVAHSKANLKKNTATPQAKRKG